MRVPRTLVPALVVLATLLGFWAARFLAAPSYTREYPGAATGREAKTSSFVVDGLKCVDTAQRLASQLDDSAGALRFVAYASRNRAEVTFDPSATTREDIIRAFEGPVYDPETQTYVFRQFKVVEVDGSGRR